MRLETHFSEDTALDLTRAFLVYERPLAGGGVEAIATVHAVERMPHTDRPFIAPGVPASRGAFIELARAMENRPETEGAASLELFPANLLLLHESAMVWHLPAHKRALFVSTSDKTFNADVNGKVVPHPALLFVATLRGGRGGLWVFALPTDERPALDTRLFRAPYLNVYEAGHLCEGSFALPRRLSPRDFEAWEAAFFDTHFSHTNVDANRLCAHPHGHHALWRELARLEQIRARNCSMAPGRFPTRYLSPLASPSTLREVLKG